MRYFFELANYILKQNGYVCGCIMDENHHAKHILSNKIEDIYKMMGSKYVQSDIKCVYKEVYNASELEEVLSNLETFTSKLKRKYPRVIDILNKNTHLLTYFDYPKEVRHSIYSTNLIEGFNKQLKKKFKLKEQFPTETSMEKYLVLQFNQYNEKFMNRIHKGFGLVGRNQWFLN